MGHYSCNIYSFNSRALIKNEDYENSQLTQLHTKTYPRTWIYTTFQLKKFEDLALSDLNMFAFYKTLERVWDLK